MREAAGRAEGTGGHSRKAACLVFGESMASLAPAAMSWHRVADSICEAQHTGARKGQGHDPMDGPRLGGLVHVAVYRTVGAHAEL